MKNKMELALFIGMLLSVNTQEAFGKSEPLNIYAWAEYIPAELIDKFEKKHDVTINYSTFENNETMYTKMKLLNGRGYDIVFASNYFITKMSHDGLLSQIDLTKIKHFDEIIPELTNLLHDPMNKYSVPYIWGATGISFNSDLIESKNAKSWNDLWKKENIKNVLLIDDIRDVFGMALKKNGFSINTKNINEIEKAYADLLLLSQNIVLFNSDAPQQPYLSGEVSIGMQWNGNAYQGNKDMPSLQFVMPEEGGILWMDSFTIPEKSTKKDLAHKFISFMYEPESQAIITETLGYASATTSGKNLLNDDLKNNTMIYPTAENLKKGEFIDDIGDTIHVYERFWNKFRNQ